MRFINHFLFSLSLPSTLGEFIKEKLPHFHISKSPVLILRSKAHDLSHALTMLWSVVRKNKLYIVAFQGYYFHKIDYSKASCKYCLQNTSAHVTYPDSTKVTPVIKDKYKISESLHRFKDRTLKTRVFYFCLFGGFVLFCLFVCFPLLFFAGTFLNVLLLDQWT